MRPAWSGARLLGWLALLGAGAAYLDFGSSLVVLELVLLTGGLYTVLAVDGQSFLWGWRHRKELRPTAISVADRKYFWLVHKGITTKIADTTTYQEMQDPAFRMVLQQWATYCRIQLFEAIGRGDIEAAKELVTYVTDADRYEIRQVAVYAQRHNALVKGFQKVALPPGRWYMCQAVDSWRQQLATA